MEIINYIQENWVGWLFAALFAMMGNSYRLLKRQMHNQKKEHDELLAEEKKKNDAIMQGIQSLLRQSIIDAHSKYSDRGHCPIYAKESLKRVYQAYHNLGGNDVATELYEELLEMPVKGDI